MTYPDLRLNVSWDGPNSIMHHHSALRITAQENPSIWAERGSFSNLADGNLSPWASQCRDTSDVRLVIDTLEQELSRCQFLNLTVERWTDGRTDVTAFGGAASKKENVRLTSLLGGDVVRCA